MNGWMRLYTKEDCIDIAKNNVVNSSYVLGLLNRIPDDIFGKVHEADVPTHKELEKGKDTMMGWFSGWFNGKLYGQIIIPYCCIAEVGKGKYKECIEE